MIIYGANRGDKLVGGGEVGGMSGEGEQGEFFTRVVRFDVESSQKRRAKEMNG